MSAKAKTVSVRSEVHQCQALARVALRCSPCFPCSEPSGALTDGSSFLEQAQRFPSLHQVFCTI